jgi:hypothetical protein
MTIAERPARNQAATPVGGIPVDVIEATSALRRHAAERLIRLCEEALRFANCRMDENRRTLHDIAAARTLPDMLGAWSRYFEHAAQQYSEELQLLSELHARQVSEAIDDLREGVFVGVEPSSIPGESGTSGARRTSDYAKTA